MQAPASVVFVGTSLCSRALAEYVRRISVEVSAPLDVIYEADEFRKDTSDAEVIVICASECAGTEDPSVFNDLRSRFPRALMVAMSPRAHTRSLVTAVGAGAKGFVACGIDDLEDVVSALVGVLQGEIAFSAEVSRLIIGELRESGAARRAGWGDGDPEALTARERGVLELLAQGRSNMQIAAALEISPNTVKNHLASVYRKLGAGSRLEAIAAATRQRLV